jgi:hypothetical protein
MKTLMSLWVVAVLAWSAHGAEPSPGALLRRISTIRLEVAGGRITSPTLSRAANRTFSEDHGEIKEALSINHGGDEPSLSYRFTGPDREWTFDLHGSRSVRLQDKTAAETLVFEQCAGRPLKLAIQIGNAPKREVTGRSLWHWLVFSPENRASLLPRLEALRPDWGLAKQASEIRQALINSDQRAWLRRRVDWERSVARLGDSDYQARQMADRALRSGGLAAAAFLESVDETELSPEQSRRVARIIAEAARDVDEPSTVVSAWCFDTEVWCLLLKDDEAEARALAAEHLVQLLGRPLVFDPSATVPIRSAQARVIEDTLIRR